MQSDSLSGTAGSEETVLNYILEQETQAPSTRASIYKAIEGHLGPNRRLVAFFTSFVFPVGISDDDGDMLEDVLRATLKPADELVLMINSPGGDPLAAERIVNICRKHSAKDQYVTIVPKMAKSAATVICMGSREILMGETSELGPIDPQVVMSIGAEGPRLFAAHEVIESYTELMQKAEQTKGQVAQFLQQLERYDATKIRHIKSLQTLCESIAVRALESGMMSGQSREKIDNAVQHFLDPNRTEVHARPIYPDAAAKCGLEISNQELQSELWTKIWELYVRLNHQTRQRYGKIVESSESSYAAARQPV